MPRATGPLPNESCERSVRSSILARTGRLDGFETSEPSGPGEIQRIPLPLRSLPDRPGAKGLAMSDDGRIPDRRDVQMLHDLIASLLRYLSKPRREDLMWDDQRELRVSALLGWDDLWLRNDLAVLQGIATEKKYWEPPREGGAPETQSRGWPPSVCQAIFRVGQLAAELRKPWRWRPGNNEYPIETLVVGQSVIDVLEWAQGVFSEAIEDASREDELRERDAFICYQRLIGRTRKEIRATVNDMAAAKGWRPLRSDQAISQVVRRVSSRTRPKPPSHK